MAPPMPEVRPGIDARWLAGAAARDPITHAYAVWDHSYERDRVEFVSFGTPGETLAYLVVWHGTPGLPMVHWIGRDHDVDPLLEAVPARPLLGVVPPKLVDGFRARRGPVREFGIEIRVLHGAVRAPEGPARARRLSRADGEAIARLLEGAASPLLQGYRGFDPEQTPTFGAFEGERLIGIAKASVTLPDVWILTGIVVEPDWRGQGVGAAVTAAAAQAAVAAGARPALYVRADNTPAVRLYNRLGFVTHARRTWLDAGGGREP